MSGHGHGHDHAYDHDHGHDHGYDHGYGYGYGWGWKVAMVVLAMGCARGATEGPPGPVVSAVVAVDAQFGAEAEASVAAFEGVNHIARRVERRHRGGHKDWAADIGAVLFDELGFQREIEDTSTRFFQLSSVIRDRRGSCLGLGALTLAVAERLGVPMDGVLLPGHFFVRTRGTGAHNVELLRRGEAMPDDWYRTKYGPWPEGGAYNRPVSPTELAAIHWYNRGNDLRQRGDLASAQQAFEKAAKAFPDFAEASASLGAVQQLRGDRLGAARSYRQAARAWPDLPGLHGNLEMLQGIPLVDPLPPDSAPR
jgi:tetratricopeptide (TPR) repeat protein